MNFHTFPNHTVAISLFWITNKWSHNNKMDSHRINLYPLNNFTSKTNNLLNQVSKEWSSQEYSLTCKTTSSNKMVRSLARAHSYRNS